MLSKLFKHEMKAMSRLLLPLYLVLLVLTVMDRIVINLDVLTHGTLQVIPGIITFMYISAIIAMIVVSFVLVVLRFYKNLMTDEGYLMFTLPVNSKQLINSKLIASFIWTVASIIAVIGSIFAVLMTQERFELFKEGINKFITDFRSEFGSLGALFIIELIVLIIISAINGILQIYTSIALGQLFNGHKILGSFGAYIGINTLMQTLVTVVLIVAGLIFKNSFEEIQSLPQIMFPITIFFMVLTSAVYYWVINFVFKKKLNLE